MSRLWAGYVGQLGRRLKINSTHSTKASESSSQNKQTNVTIIMCRCPCLTQKQNATVGVGRQCLTLGRAGLMVATDSDVCRPMWIILCGHFSQMSPLAKQSVRNQNWCLAHNLYLFLPFTARASGEMGIFWYVVRIPRILVNPVELVNPWEIMKLLETMNPVKLLSLLPTVTLLRDCCDIALFLLSKNRKGWVPIRNWACPQVVYLTPYIKLLNGSTKMPFSITTRCSLPEFGLTVNWQFVGLLAWHRELVVVVLLVVVVGDGGGRREPVESSLCPTSNLTFISRKPGPAFCPVSIYTMKSIDRPENNFYVLTMTLTHTQIFNLLNLFISLETDKHRPDSGNIRNCSTTRRD